MKKNIVRVHLGLHGHMRRPEDKCVISQMPFTLIWGQSLLLT